jgi:hypothetical protein
LYVIADSFIGQSYGFGYPPVSGGPIEIVAKSNVHKLADAVERALI